MTDRPAVSPAVARISALLLADIDALSDAVAGAIAAAERTLLPAPNYERLRDNNRRHLTAVLTYLAGGPETGLPIARETGCESAAEGVPLPVVLRTYRIAARVTWDRAMALTGDELGAGRALLATASEVWRLVDDYSQAMTIGYQEAMSEIQRRDARLRDAALDALLTGRVDGGNLREYADIVRLPVQSSYAVVAAASESAAAEPLPGVGEALTALGVRSAWRVRVDTQIGIVAVTDTFTLERLTALLGERATGAVGVSAAYGMLTDTAAALRQAELACATAQSDSDRVVRYDRALIPVLLAGAPEIADALIQRVLGPLLELPEHDRATLLETMSAWFASDGEVAAVAGVLFCHRNTVRFRLNRITDLTGRRFTAPAESAELFLALHAYRSRRTDSAR
ncbi:PucR family transcriptional regulator [Nocardia inohanensis]|uniref:PucR family transcriptional regulator n=1 Tax=Nocardia inohanensis TaxID=209246 RepID=UPI00082A708C|nr:helix-turn-helix domain-containing protein [Nocardia inohanensis]